MDGILVVDKPKGWTSHDVVAFLRRRLGTRVGHAGTLDPLATGVLVILVGRATKRSAELSGAEKAYRATLRLGEETDTQDAEGRVVSRREVPPLTEEGVAKTMETFRGEQMQVPPMFSAVKYRGQPLYRYGRKGIEVERRARRIEVRDIRMTGFHPPEVEIEATVSKGTYLRTLCSDIGKRLGCGAHLSALRRIRSGRFTEMDALSLEALRRMSPAKLAGLLKESGIPMGAGP